MYYNLTSKNTMRSLIVVLLSIAVMVGFLIIPGVAGASTTTAQTVTPQSAVSTVNNATSAAQQATGVIRSGDPSNTPSVSTAGNGEVTAVSPVATIGVKLPSVPSTQSSAMGASVMTSTSSSQAIAVVNPQQGGLQVSQDILGPTAPQSFVYHLTLPVGYKPVLQTSGVNSGTIALTSATGTEALSASNTIGFVDRAWAEDASGKAVPTNFSVNGLDITQTVNTAGVTAWPVVADPSITFGWVIYVHFYHHEVGNALLHAFIAGAGAAASLVCTAISIGYLVPVCMFLFGAATDYILSIFSTAYNRGGGLVWEFAYTGSPVGYMYVGDNWT